MSFNYHQAVTPILSMKHQSQPLVWPSDLTFRPSLRHDSGLWLVDFYQSQALVWPSDLLHVMIAGCDWWISTPPPKKKKNLTQWLYSLSLGTWRWPKRNRKQCLCKFLGGKRSVLMVCWMHATISFTKCPSPLLLTSPFPTVLLKEPKIVTPKYQICPVFV